MLIQRSLPILIALILLFSTVGWSADFKKGYEALLKKDYATALREFKLLAKEGHAVAQFKLGLMYYYGKGGSKNDKAAVKWDRLAAEQGHVIAQLKLGMLYYKGEGIPKNDKMAV